MIANKQTVWMNKDTGDLFIAEPFWRMGTYHADYYSFYQFGWVIENKNTVMVVLPIEAKKYFEFIGEF